MSRTPRIIIAAGLGIALLGACTSIQQPAGGTELTHMQPLSLEQRIQIIEDRAALKALGDTFSNLADAKDVKSQVLLFTEDATVHSYVGGALTTSLKGREQIGQRFGEFLASFNAVYHHNGQQTVDIRGDRATGVSYCYVVLVAPRTERRPRPATA